MGGTARLRRGRAQLAAGARPDRRRAAEIAWAQANAYERLETQNDERIEPIRRLNERYGYVATPGTITVRGPVGPAVSS